MRTILAQGFGAAIPARKCLLFEVVASGGGGVSLSCRIKGMGGRMLEIARYPNEREATVALDDLNAWLSQPRPESGDEENEYGTYLMPGGPA